MSKNNGFTLVELLAVIVILAVILAVAVPSISNLIDDARVAAYQGDARLLEKAARNYIATDETKLPVNVGDISIINLSDLQTGNYVSTIKDLKDSSITCTGYVSIKKLVQSQMEYTPYLKCGSNYQTTGYISQNLTAVEVLVVAGGGSGGSHTGSTSTAGGGGGAGGLIFNGSYAVSAGQSLNVSVGTGGTGTISGGNGGQNSVFGTLSATGGGRGTGLGHTTNVSGGSGGGGSYYGSTAGTGVAGQGNNGGTSITQPSPFPAAGGGGAGSVGRDSTATVAGNGGDGLYYGDKFGDANGSSGWFAGGGGGGIGAGGAVGNRGLGKAGGGDGAYNNTNGISATANTGSGGGGSGLNVTSGGNGGSGVVLVRYLGAQRANGGTVTTVNGYTVHAFTSGTSNFAILSF